MLVAGAPLEVADALTQRLSFRRIGKPRELGIAQMRDVFHANFCGRDQTFHPEIRHGFMRALHSIGIEFHPPGVGQFHKTARSGGEAFQIGFA